MSRQDYAVVVKQTHFEDAGYADVPVIDQIICYEGDLDYLTEMIEQTVLEPLMSEGWRRSREYYAGGYILKKPGVKLTVTCSNPLRLVNM